MREVIKRIYELILNLLKYRINPIVNRDAIIRFSHIRNRGRDAIKFMNRNPIIKMIVIPKINSLVRLYIYMTPS